MLAEDMVVCGNCGREWNKAALSACPGCKAKAFVATPVQTSSSTGPVPSISPAASHAMNKQNDYLETIARNTAETASHLRSLRLGFFALLAVVALNFFFVLLSARGK